MLSVYLIYVVYRHFNFNLEPHCVLMFVHINGWLRTVGVGVLGGGSGPHTPRGSTPLPLPNFSSVHLPPFTPIFVSGTLS